MLYAMLLIYITLICTYNVYIIEKIYLGNYGCFVHVYINKDPQKKTVYYLSTLIRNGKRLQVKDAVKKMIN